MATPTQRNFFTEQCTDSWLEELGAHYCMVHGQYLRQCKWCSVWFHSDRPHTQYCCNADRQKAYRARRQSERQFEWSTNDGLEVQS